MIPIRRQISKCLDRQLPPPTEGQLRRLAGLANYLTMHTLVQRFYIVLIFQFIPVIALSAELALSSAQLDGRAWTSDDSTKVRYFLRNQMDASWSHLRDPEEVVISPDGKAFFFVSYRGDLDCDCNRYELQVFKAMEIMNILGTDNIQRPPVPAAVVKMSHASQAIRGASWDGDSSGIVFLGKDGPNLKAPYQLYRLDMTSKQVTRLTDAAEGTGAFYRKGDGLIFHSRVPIEIPANPDAYPIHSLMKSEILSEVGSGESRSAISLETFVSFRGGPAWRLNSDPVISGGPWFSPNGRQAVMIRRLKEVPPTWARYNGTDIATGARQQLVPSEFPQFFFVDLEREKVEPIFDAPTGEATGAGEARAWNASQAPLKVPTDALWSEDGGQVVLVNTALPLTESAPESSDMAYIVSYDVKTRSWQVLEPLHHPSGRRVSNVTWIRIGRELLVQHELDGKPMPGTVYALRRRGWRGHTVNASVEPPRQAPANPPVLRKGLMVTLQEGANLPPRVVASKDGREIRLTDTDAALQGIWWAQTLPFEWRDDEGALHVDGLLLPRGSASSVTQLPLVIQAGYYVPDQFRPDGPLPTGYAAQAMVARGIAVLNLTTPKEVEGSSKELPTFVEWVESAATSLAQRYPIDLQKVGLMGFSRTAFQTYYAITHPRRLRLAAAVLADGVTGSYLLYLDGFARGGFAPADFERLYGGPFYDARSSWLEHETSFNVHRVETPAMFVGDANLYALETVGAFKASQRVFEYLVMPDSPHQLERPRQRKASIEATVDWMSFWLQGKEDSSPEKANYYKRWRSLREEFELQRKRTNKSPLAPE